MSQTRSSSRVLARPGGASSMGSILGDPNARFDAGAPRQQQRPQQQQQQQQAPQQQQQRPQQQQQQAPQQQQQQQYGQAQTRGGASQLTQQRHDAFTAGFNNASQNRNRNQVSSVFGDAPPPQQRAAPQQQQQQQQQ